MVGAVIAVGLLGACGGGGGEKAHKPTSTTSKDLPLNAQSCATHTFPAGSPAQIYCDNVQPPHGNAPPTTVAPIATRADACAKLHSVSDPSSGRKDAVVAVLPQLEAVFAGVPSDIGGDVVVPGLDDSTQLQEMLIWCFGHNDGR